MITLNQLCFPPQGSIGDIIVIAGAATWFSERCHHVYFPVTKDNVEFARTLFKENKKITVIEYTDMYTYTDLNEFIQKNKLTIFSLPEVVRITNSDNVTCTVLWDEQFYTFFDLPFSIRYSHFRLPSNLPESILLYQRIVTNPRYILVAKKMGSKDQTVNIDLDSARSTENLDALDNFQVIELTEDITSNIILYAELIKHAEEIHCVPSSIFCFVDSITHTTSAKLFYHDIRANTIMRVNNTWNNKRWKIIKYDRKL